ncbi:patellin-3 [Prosopis cineraria]|uniref:patellin-3 n=1 Tax=Prosopis cineraria TaxID=364024 RepID=UPI00240F4439|nr:patellin-3 [Prosopis cineraria]
MADEDSKPSISVTETKELGSPKVTAESDSPDVASASAVESDSAAVNTENTDLPPPPPSESLAAEASTVVETEQPPPPPTEDIDVKAKSSDTKEDSVAAQDERSKKLPQNLVSFKEESNLVADLSDSQRNAFEEFKKLVREALDTHQFTSSVPPKTTPVPAETTPAAKEVAKAEGASSESDASTEVQPQHETKLEENPVKGAEEVAKTSEEQVFIWGVPLLKDDRSDVILLKFLRARDFKVKDAFIMIKNTISWRKEFNIDALVNEDLGDDLEKVVFMHGYDREGHPVCYNVYGEFQNKELYQKAFSDEEKRAKFLRWRIQFLERSIRKLDFTPGGVNTIFQINDLKNSPGPGKRELRIATKQALQLLQDNYPEFVAKQVFINVPWWYLAFYTMISPFLTQRTKSKFVFAGPSKSPETLFKYISPEQVPIQYGGLSVDLCDCNPEFSMSDPVTEVPIKPTTKQTVEIIIYEKCTIVWELRVVGWEVSYSAEFKPDAKDGYTVIIQKATKMCPTDEPVVSNSFKVGELGKILLTIDNSTLKKKRLLYRFKIKPLSV